MLGQEGIDLVGLVRADVVADDVDLFAGRLTCHHVAQEGNELRTGVTRCGAADDLTGGGVERGEQTQGAIAFVFEAVALGAPRRQRQHAVLAIERLNGGLDLTLLHGRLGT